MGCLMIDIAGLMPSVEECERLAHPAVGGVILFARNYASREQLGALCAKLHSLRSPPLLIATDHEGGRVQRFREGFTRLPAMRRLGELWDVSPSLACQQAQAIGFLLAAELRACGVDLSFTPVLDLDRGMSTVIGERAFHRRPEAVIALAGALIDGLRAAGMACCGKHFPGHGGVAADSHVALPRDERPLTEIDEDLQVFRQLPLDALMPAHVVYPALDEQPAGFSVRWLGRLRDEFGFAGAIFSDDLSMAGASIAGDVVERCHAAAQAGCDMLLVCNDSPAAVRAIEGWRQWGKGERPDLAGARLARLRPSQPAWSWSELVAQPLWQVGHEAASRLVA